MKLSRIARIGMLGLLASSTLAFADHHMPATSMSQQCSQWTGCDLTKMASDKVLGSQLTVEKDPIGLAVSSSDQKANIEGMLQTYATNHQCNLYVISMNDMVKGLFKSSSVSGKQSEQSGNKKNRSAVQHSDGVKITQLQNPMNNVNIQAKINQNSQMNMGNKYMVIAADKAQCVKKLNFKLPVKKLDGESKGGKR